MVSLLPQTTPEEFNAAVQVRRGVHLSASSLTIELWGSERRRLGGFTSHAS